MTNHCFGTGDGHTSRGRGGWTKNKEVTHPDPSPRPFLRPSTSILVSIGPDERTLDLLLGRGTTDGPKPPLGPDRPSGS